MTKEKIEIVTKMVEDGYNLFNKTIEHFANRFTLEVLEVFEKNFNTYKKR